MTKSSDKKPLVITEGKTDWQHLKKALERFQSDGIYTNLNIEFEEYIPESVKYFRDSG
jgi:5S rRNA maturation endonuclease (ribonuclease M5)